MPNLTPVCQLLKAFMPRMCFYLTFIGSAASANAAPDNAPPPAQTPDIFAVQKPADYRASRFSAAPVNKKTLVAVPEKNPLAKTSQTTEFRAGNTLQRLLSAEPGAETSRSIWKIFSLGSHGSLSPAMQFATQKDVVEIEPRRHSISVLWRKAFR